MSWNLALKPYTYVTEAFLMSKLIMGTL